MRAASGSAHRNGNSGKNQKCATADKLRAAASPPATPSHVFPGLIAGANLCLPIALPT